MFVDADLKCCCFCFRFGERLFSFNPTASSIVQFSYCGPHHLKMKDVTAQDFGIQLNKQCVLYLQQFSDAEKEQFLQLLQGLQSRVLLLVHMLSGSPGRAADLAELKIVVGRDKVKCLYALTSSQLEIVTLVHKHERRQVGHINVVRRHPPYSVCCVSALWAAFASAVSQAGQSSFWLPQFAVANKLLDVWKQGTLESFGQVLHFNDFRYIMQYVLFEYRSEIEQFSLTLGGDAAIPIQHLNSGTSKVGRPGATELANAGFGHSAATANTHYLVNAVGDRDWLRSNLAIQKVLGVFEIFPVEAEAEVRLLTPCLLPSTEMSDHDVDAWILDKLESIYGERNFRSDVQQIALSLCLKGEQDVVVAGACGVGKSAVFSVSALAAQEKASCVLLLCPMSSVVYTACNIMKKTTARTIVVGDNDETKKLAADLAQGRLHYSLVIATFEQLQRNMSLSQILFEMKRQHLLVRCIIDEVHILLQGLSWRSAFASLGDLRYRIGFNVVFQLLSASLPQVAMEPLQEFLCLSSNLTYAGTPHPVAPKLDITVTLQNNSANLISSVVETLAYWMLTGSTHENRPNRALVVAMTRVEVQEIMTALNKNAQFAAMSTFGFSSDTDWNAAETVQALSNANILVSTTVVTTAMNIPNLKFAVMVGSAYSLSDIYQVMGRIGRDGSWSLCEIIFCQQLHYKHFSGPGTTPFLNTGLAPLLWAKQHARDQTLRRAMTHVGVAELCGRTIECRRKYIDSVFGYGGQPLSCLECGNGDAVARCDLCHSKEQPEPQEKLAAATSEREAQQVLFPLAAEDIAVAKHQQQEDVNEQYVLLVLQQLMTSWKTMNDRYPVVKTCFMCGTVACNGFKQNNGRGPPCPGRTKIAGPWVSGLICFACGGHHVKDSCPERSDGPQEIRYCATDLTRSMCCLDYLPQERAGLQNIPHDSVLACRNRGDQLFPILCAMKSATPEIQQRFRDEFEGLVTSCPFGPGQKMRVFMSWCQLLSPLGSRVYNMYMVLGFALKILQET